MKKLFISKKKCVEENSKYTNKIENLHKSIKNICDYCEECYSDMCSCGSCQVTILSNNLHKEDENLK